MMNEYKLIRLSENRLADLQIIYKDAFKKEISLHELQLLFETSFTGKKFIGYIAYSPDGFPAAYYGVFPCFVESNGKRHLCAQSGVTMTHSAHRGKGLFTKTALATYDLAKQEGIECVFGFPNEFSYPGFVKKLAWQHNENIQKYEFNIFTIPVAAAVNKFSLFQKSYQSFFKNILPNLQSFDTPFFSSVATEHRSVIYRDSDFMKYKSQTGSNIISVFGKKVWLKANSFLFIGDVEKTDSQNFTLIFKKLQQIARLSGCKKMIFQTSPNTWLDHELKKFKAPEEGLAIGYLPLSEKIDGSSLSFVGADFDTF